MFCGKVVEIDHVRNADFYIQRYEESKKKSVEIAGHTKMKSLKWLYECILGNRVK
jgi:hypothetical protein